MKKIISVFLALVMLTALMAPCASAVSSRGSIPVIYIRGNGERIVDDEGNLIPARAEDLQLGDFNKDTLVDALVNITVPLVTEGLLFDEWEGYGKAVYNEIRPLFEGAQLDGNGNSLPGIGMSAESKKNNLTTCNVSRSSYGLWDYQFHYDWRLSPYDSVDGLHEYIQKVSAANGGKKVALFPVCFGGSLAVAYLERYGHLGLVDSVMFDATLNNGSAVINDIFSGQISFQSARLQQYLSQMEQCDYYGVGFGLTIEGLANEIIFKTIDLFSQTGTADSLFDSVEELYTKLYKALMPALCFASGLATQTNYWTCVYEEDMDAALELMFGSEEAKTEYAGLIEKIEYYREHVTSQGDALYKKFAEEYGIRIGAVAKYGYMNMPLSDSVSEPSDALVSLEDASFGATVADIGSTLPESYLAGVESRFISADKMVDTSTCLFPETTWIVKNAHHNFFSLDNIIAQAFFFDEADVNTLSELPQFMRYYEATGAYEPLTEENCQDYDWYAETTMEPTTESMLVSMMRWFRMIFELLTKLLKGELELGSLLNK